MAKSRIGGEVKRILPLVSFGLYYVGILAAVRYSIENNLAKWPFNRVNNIEEAYESVLQYSPVLLLVIVSFVWLRLLNIPILSFYSIRKPTWWFYAIAILSLGYSFYMLFAAPYGLRDYSYWPPVFILSILNAFSEETFYRYTLWELLRAAAQNRLYVVCIQSFFYALPHLWIGGLELAILAFVYGILIGIVREKEGSVTYCIICHFIVDIGNIGLPILIL